MTSGGWPAAEGGRDRAAPETLATRARTALARDDERLSLRHACEAANVRVQSEPLAVGGIHHTAMLVPAREGFHAWVDPELWRSARASSEDRRKLRFVLAHELGHTFFY